MIQRDWYETSESRQWSSYLPLLALHRLYLRSAAIIEPGITMAGLGLYSIQFESSQAMWAVGPWMVIQSKNILEIKVCVEIVIVMPMTHDLVVLINKARW